MHQGIDFAAQSGAPIHATASGKVIHSGWEAGYGKSVVLEHDSGLQTRYAHCSKLLVKEGARVSQGDTIAKVGSTGHSTGPHLHFEVIVQGERKNPAWYYPMDPEQQHIASNQ
jgi:murein DD-endopeptidase MepM/ murein hydrolase activator NlpD